MTLHNLLTRALEQVGGSQKDLAKALGLSRPRINRALRGDGYPLGFQACLNLAELCGEYPDVVLAAAQKAALAAQLDRLYKTTPQTREQRRLLRDFEALSPENQKRISGITSDLAAVSRRRTQVRSHGR